MTDAELNRAVCEKVLGWEWSDSHAGLTWYTDHGGKLRHEFPDFLHDWNAFGLLLMALASRHPHIFRSEDGAWACYLRTNYWRAAGWSGACDDPKRALAVAALNTYGVDVQDD